MPGSRPQPDHGDPGGHHRPGRRRQPRRPPGTTRRPGGGERTGRDDRRLRITDGSLRREQGARNAAGAAKRRRRRAGNPCLDGSDPRSAKSRRQTTHGAGSAAGGTGRAFRSRGEPAPYGGGRAGRCPGSAAPGTLPEPGNGSGERAGGPCLDGGPTPTAPKWRRAARRGAGIAAGGNRECLPVEKASPLRTAETRTGRCPGSAAPGTLPEPGNGSGERAGGPCLDSGPTPTAPKWRREVTRGAGIAAGGTGRASRSSGEPVPGGGGRPARSLAPGASRRQRHRTEERR